MTTLLLFLGGGGARTAADSLATTDVATRAGNPARTAADSLGTTDAIVVRLPRTSADTLGTTDAAHVVRVTRIASDTLGTSDVALRNVFLRGASDSLGTTDAATRPSLSRARIASDTLGTTDATGAVRLVSASDTLGTSDVAIGFQARIRFAADTLGTTDQPLGGGGGGPTPIVRWRAGLAIPARTSLTMTISSHQERLRRLELAVGGGAAGDQVAFVDGALNSNWNGRLRSAPFQGTAASAARVYLDVAVTRTSGALQVGTLATSARPASTRYLWGADMAGNMIQLTVAASGVVSVSAYNGSEIDVVGSYVL